MKAKLFSQWEIIPIFIILAVMALAVFLYPQLPDQIPSHWNINGDIDAWSSKNFAVSFFPALIIAVYALMSGLIFLDPMRKNIESFSFIYFWMKTGVVLFLSFIYIITLLVGMGYEINVARMIILGIAALFLLFGLVMPEIKKNYMVGIRLPWTLHSEKVWNKTHKFGGKLFIALGIIMAAAYFLPVVYSFWILIGGIILMLVALVIYSYLEYKKEK
ncbi:MAG: hypothetical protein UV40_C0017G0005 [Parcubacteria group bacterium GW2011_GWA1_42_7]|nr:MAG: hypothetical protein UV34_C0003G0004 [Parcubacteria group bacterium GW2011_GWB1_42_6]KKS69661.1 MAG: hypothetical protein UV40_C0017G0005 [Parcubacteria group bacterium GW2011_GWA1_42_7]